MPRFAQRDYLIVPSGIEKPIRLSHNEHTMIAVIVDDSNQNGPCFLELHEKCPNLSTLNRAFDGSLYQNEFNSSTLAGTIKFFRMEPNFSITELNVIEYSLPHIAGPSSFLDSNICIFSHDTIIYTFFGNHSEYIANEDSEDDDDSNSCSFAYNLCTKELTFLCEGIITVNDENSCVVAHFDSFDEHVKFISPELNITELQFNIPNIKQVGVVNLGISALYGRGRLSLVNHRLETVSLDHLVSGLGYISFNMIVLLSVTDCELVMLLICDKITQYVRFKDGKLIHRENTGFGFDMLFYPHASVPDQDGLNAIAKGFEYQPMLALGKQMGNSGIFKLRQRGKSIVEIPNVQNFTMYNNLLRYTNSFSEVMLDFARKSMFVIDHNFLGKREHELHIKYLNNNSYAWAEYKIELRSFNRGRIVRESVDMTNITRDSYIQKHESKLESIFAPRERNNGGNNHFCCYFRGERLFIKFEDDGEHVLMLGTSPISTFKFANYRPVTDERSFVCFCHLVSFQSFVLMYDEETEKILTLHCDMGILNCYSSPYNNRCLVVESRKKSLYLSIENGAIVREEFEAFKKLHGWLSADLFLTDSYIYDVSSGIPSQIVYIPDVRLGEHFDAVYVSPMAFHIIQSPVSPKEGFIIKHVTISEIGRGCFNYESEIEILSFQQIFEDFEVSVHEIFSDFADKKSKLY
ncbi:hypothetical protein PCE1_004791 [Barthelona sp. PCE]